MVVKVDQETCIGCAACVAVAPEVFEINDEGLAKVIETPVKKENIEAATETITVCPVYAISEEK